MSATSPHAVLAGASLLASGISARYRRPPRQVWVARRRSARFGLNHRSKEIEMDTTSDRIEDDVRNALADDPRIRYVNEIAVDAYGGGVTLRGTVGSFAEQHAAVADARRTRGVIDVYDDLHVRLLDQDRREDAEIRGAALQRLIWDPELVADYLDVQVKEGWVTLRGDVDHQFQSDKAFDHAASLYGVTGVTNDIKVVEAL